MFHTNFNPYNADLFWRTMVFFEFEIIIYVLAISFASFEYLCYGFTAIRNIFTLTARGLSLYVSI